MASVADTGSVDLTLTGSVLSADIKAGGVSYQQLAGSPPMGVRFPLTVSVTQPASPATGDLWLDLDAVRPAEAQYRNPLFVQTTQPAAPVVGDLWVIP